MQEIVRQLLGADRARRPAPPRPHARTSSRQANDLAAASRAATNPARDVERNDSGGTESLTQKIRRSVWSLLLWSLISNTASAQDIISISGTVTPGLTA